MPNRTFNSILDRQILYKTYPFLDPDAYQGSDTYNPRALGYLYAARRLFALPTSWEERLAYKIFGPAVIAKAAMALDVTSRFKTGFERINYETRRRLGQVHVSSFGWNIHVKEWHYMNYHVDNPGTVDEYLAGFGEHDERQDPGLDDLRVEDHMSDSTQSQRLKGVEFGTMESFRCVNHSYDNWGPITTTREEIYQLAGGQYDRLVIEQTYTWDGPMYYPVDGWLTSADFGEAFGNDGSLTAYAKAFAEKHLYDMLTACLANRRLFNAFYQLGELKDLPLMISKTLAMKQFLSDAVKDPRRAVQDLDKASSDAFLNNEFGYQSILQAVTGLLNFPAKLAKRFNYLMKHSQKRVVGRFAKDWLVLDDAYRYINPAVQYFLPGEFEVFENEFSAFQKNSLRFAVNQTLQFPEVSVASLDNATFRDLLGLQPRLIDIYNLVPWTWLLDYYDDLGSYINCVESLRDERFLVNYGFATFVMRAVFNGEVSFRCRDQSTTYSPEGAIVLHTVSNEREFTVDSNIEYVFTKRMNIADLDGMKSVDNKNDNLTDQQKQILAALLAKFT